MKHKQTNAFPVPDPSSLLIYQSEDGRTKTEVQLQDETVWLTQKNMAELFQTTKQNIGQHLKSGFTERSPTFTPQVLIMIRPWASASRFSKPPRIKGVGRKRV